MDLMDESHCSKVYSANTKRGLSGIFARLIHLYVFLTGIAILVFPFNDTPGWSRGKPPRILRVPEVAKLHLGDGIRTTLCVAICVTVVVLRLKSRPQATFQLSSTLITCTCIIALRELFSAIMKFRSLQYFKFC